MRLRPCILQAIIRVLVASAFSSTHQVRLSRASSCQSEGNYRSGRRQFWIQTTTYILHVNIEHRPRCRRPRPLHPHYQVDRIRTPRCPADQIPTTAVELRVTNRVWYRGLALIRNMREWGPSPETRTTPPYPRLPQEIVEIIVAYLIYDMPSLQACSLTCYSLHIATVPHLHHTFTVDANSWLPSWSAFCPRCMRKHRHSSSIWSMDALGLLPLVQRLHICDTGYSWKFRPQLHAEAPTVLLPLPTDTSISRLDLSRRVPLAGYILHRTISAPGGPRTPLRVAPPPGGTGGRLGTHPRFCPSPARTASNVVF